VHDADEDRRRSVTSPIALTAILKRASTIRAHASHPIPQIKKRSIRAPQFYRFTRGRFSVDAFAFEFMGLVMIALCLVVLAIPSGRRRSRRIRYE
jgi:hypothetical protein